MSDVPDDILKTAGGVVADICGDARMTLMGDVEKMAQPIAAAIHAERKRWQREVSDKLYMLQAYREMMGPIGLQVADMWRASGVQRVHHDWGPDAAAMTGEERAKFLLDLEATLTPRRTET